MSEDISEQVAVNAVKEVMDHKGRDSRSVSFAASFRELAIDSLDLAEVLVILEEQVGHELDPASAYPLQGVADLVKLKMNQ